MIDVSYTNIGSPESSVAAWSSSRKLRIRCAIILAAIRHVVWRDAQGSGILGARDVDWHVTVPIGNGRVWLRLKDEDHAAETSDASRIHIQPRHHEVVNYIVGGRPSVTIVGIPDAVRIRIEATGRSYETSIDRVPRDRDGKAIDVRSFVNDPILQFGLKRCSAAGPNSRAFRRRNCDSKRTGLRLADRADGEQDVDAKKTSQDFSVSH